MFRGVHKLFVMAALVAVVASLGITATPTRAASPSGATVIATCRGLIGAIAEVGERTCRTAEAATRGLANACRNVGLTDTCALVDGRALSEAHIASYERSWTHRALSLQRKLDRNVPFVDSLLPHTHNSFNSAVYSPPTLTNQDPNQVYSMYNQLRMDIRAIEMDVHWVPSIYGSAKTGYNAVTLCHGQVQAGVHIGCSIDRPLRNGLAELRNWLTRPGNENEVVLLYLENNLDNNVTAHNEVARTLKHVLGDLIYQPPAAEPCQVLPTGISPAQIRRERHQVIIVGNCGPGAWGSWVFERGPAQNWEESGSDDGNDYPGLQSGCATERKRTHAGTAIVRWYEDSTWLSAMVSGMSGHLTTTEAIGMAKCGANLIGFDQLTPEDPRLAAIVWSWDTGLPRKPTNAPACARSQANTHFGDDACTIPYAFACTKAGQWFVTSEKGPWNNGAAVCSKEFPNSSFHVPVNGWQNSLLRSAAGSRTVWLHYADLTGTGDWQNLHYRTSGG